MGRKLDGYSQGFLWVGVSNDSGIVNDDNFWRFSGYFFGNVRDKASNIICALLKTAQWKAPGPGDVAIELLQFGGEMTLNKLHVSCMELWETGIWPDEWTQSVFIPLPKKGDLLQCNNYRIIALVSNGSKILMRVILDRMQVKLESEIAQEQARFRPIRGTRVQITNLWIILEKARERNQTVCFCFIDFTKANMVQVQHDQLSITMLEMGFPPHLVQLLWHLYSKQLAAVRTTSYLSAWFHVKKGVWQGCNLSPCLFNILAEQVILKALKGFPGGLRIDGRTISNLRYADDIVLLATSPEELQELVSRVERVAKAYNILINATKTKVMTNNDCVKGTTVCNEGATPPPFSIRTSVGSYIFMFSGVSYTQRYSQPGHGRSHVARSP